MLAGYRGRSAAPLAVFAARCLRSGSIIDDHVAQPLYGHPLVESSVEFGVVDVVLELELPERRRLPESSEGPRIHDLRRMEFVVASPLALHLRALLVICF